MNEQPIAIDARFIYHTRLLLFVETAPQSNEYRQVILNHRQFETVSDALFKVSKGTVGQPVNLRVNLESFIFPTEIRDHVYEPQLEKPAAK